jgi:hypothetical protein
VRYSVLLAIFIAGGLRKKGVRRQEDLRAENPVLFLVTRELTHFGVVRNHLSNGLRTVVA